MEETFEDIEEALIKDREIYNEEFRKYIPLDKSFIIRVVLLDLTRGYREDSVRFFKNNKMPLSDDIITVGGIVRDWPAWKFWKDFDGRDSASATRHLQFYLWQTGSRRKIRKNEGLQKRNLTNNPDIVNWPIKELMKLEYGTSQWASAAALFRDKEKVLEEMRDVEEVPFKLDLTVHTRNYWEGNEASGWGWEPRLDMTIARQMKAYVEFLKYGGAHFKCRQSEDVPFAAILCDYDLEKAKDEYPSLKGHESDRIPEIRKTIKQLEQGLCVDSKDHRIISAAAMRQSLYGKSISVKYPEYISKAWPVEQFLGFMNYCRKTYGIKP